MSPFRIAGLTCLAAALLVLDVSLGLLHATWQSISLASLIAAMSPGGLGGLAGFVSGLSPFLWNGILLPFFSLPFWLTLTIVAVVLIAVGRNRAD